jgi:hypothetical protein
MATLAVSTPAPDERRMALIKPLSELTPDDLALFALWEYAMGDEDEHDETAVRPVDSDVVPVEEDNNVYHVACDVELANGRVLTGHASVCNGEPDFDPPTVVDDAGEAFDLEHPPHRRQQAAFAALFGAPFAEVFPVRWRLRLPLAGEVVYREGEIGLPPEPAASRVH